MWFIYIALCSKDNTLYTGITNDLDRRIKQHNDGVGAKYTKGRGPISLVKFFTRKTKGEALKLEYRIKQMSAKEKLEFEDAETN
jgi:putative endonuclease